MAEDNFAYERETPPRFEIPGVTPVITNGVDDSFDVIHNANFIADSHDVDNRETSFSSNDSHDGADGLGATSRVRLTWTNISVTATLPTGLLSKRSANKKKILKNVSGYAEPGSLLAIMGSSGAGKSTLLNMLTWRNREGLHLDGEIRANGIELGPDITSVSAYVQQDDLFMGELTVKEHLTFSARLRMDGSTSDAARSERVHEVMRQMGLKKCENTAIGTPGKSKTISGGEMKRLSFASELLNKPSIWFCDEPTSGLDSYLAKVIVECMQTVAKEGCTVICTIHQPSSEVFELFDRLMLLALGEVVYHGSAQGALDHYNKLKVILNHLISNSVGFPCPLNFNPADHYIMSISVVPGNEDDSKQQIASFVESYHNSDYYKDLQKHIDAFNENEQDRNALALEVTEKKNKPRYRVGFFSQLHACQVRAFKTTYRNPLLSRVKVAQTLFSAIICGLIYLRPNFLKPYLSKNVAAVTGSIFLAITNTSITTAIGVMNSFPAEIPIFRRDHFNGMYSTAVYFLTKNLADLPTYIVLPMLYTIVVYFMFGLYPGAAQFFIFYALLVLLSNTCVSFGYMIAAMSPSIAVALAIGPPLLIPLLLLGGFYIPPNDIPIWLIWLKYMSFFFYTNEMLNINQWQNVGYLGCNMTAQTDDLPCLYEDGKTVLRSYHYGEAYFGRDIGCMFALLFGYRAIALIVLYWRVRESTR